MSQNHPVEELCKLCSIQMGASVTVQKFCKAQRLQSASIRKICQCSVCQCSVCSLFLGCWFVKTSWRSGNHRRPRRSQPKPSSCAKIGEAQTLWGSSETNCRPIVMIRANLKDTTEVYLGSLRVVSPGERHRKRTRKGPLDAGRKPCPYKAPSPGRSWTAYQDNGLS